MKYRQLLRITVECFSELSKINVGIKEEFAIELLDAIDNKNKQKTTDLIFELVEQIKEFHDCEENKTDKLDELEKFLDEMINKLKTTTNNK